MPVKIFDTMLVRVNTQMFLNTRLRGTVRNREIELACQAVVAETTMLSGDSLTFGALVSKIRAILAATKQSNLEQFDAEALAEAISGPA